MATVSPLQIVHDTLGQREKLKSWNLLKEDLTPTLWIPEKLSPYPKRPCQKAQSASPSSTLSHCH